MVDVVSVTILLAFSDQQIMLRRGSDIREPRGVLDHMVQTYTAPLALTNEGEGRDSETCCLTVI